MPASRERRRKIAAIIILTGGRTVQNLDNDVNDSIEELLYTQLCRAVPLTAIDDGDTDPENEAVWTEITVISDLYADHVPTHSELQKESDALEAFLDDAGL